MSVRKEVINGAFMRRFVGRRKESQSNSDIRRYHTGQLERLALPP